MTDLSALSDDELISLYQERDASRVMPALIKQESGGRAGVLGPPTKYGRAEGMTQMLPATAQATAQKAGLPWRPELMRGTSPEAAEYQRTLGQHYLQEGIDATGSVEDGIAYYHGGPNRKQWGPKTQAYVQKVSSNMRQPAGPDLSSLSDEELLAAYGSAAPTPPPKIDRGRGVVPTIGDMRTLADPAYAKARKNVAQSDALKAKAPLPGLSNWITQAAGSTGVMDEIHGFGAQLSQGAGNLIRRATGQNVEIPAATAGQAARDAERERQATYAREHPVLSPMASVAGIATAGRPTGAPVKMGALKAGGVAAGVNAPFALARQKGDLGERLPGAAAETAVAFGAGGLLQGAANGLSASAAKSAAKPLTPARQLSNMGVELTPGQMMNGNFRRIEDVLTSAPLTGFGINSARTRGLESFNRVAINRALAPIGQSLPKGVNVGREGVKTANAAVSKAYTDALDGVNVIPDQRFGAEVSAIVNRPGLRKAAKDELRPLVDDWRARFSGAIPGQAWKEIDAEIGAAIRSADNATASAPAQKFLRDALKDLKSAHFGALERANPGAAVAVKKADEAMASLVRIQEAAQSATTASKAGVFTPPQLNSAVRNADNTARNRAYGQGDALMQDLTDPAMQVLPPSVPDSGTALRAALGTGYAGGLATQPGVVAPVIGVDAIGMALYSKPAQAAFNAVYRAISPGAKQAALSKLAALAARNPQLVPLYEQAVQHAAARLPQGGDRQIPRLGQPQPSR